MNGPRIVAITCDDGPWPGNTTTVMNHMRNAGLEHDFGLVHFFMVGNYVAAFPDVAREVFERGYGIGNHSLTHSTYSASGLAREIPLAQDVFSSVLGWAPELFRAPGLAKADALQAQLYRLGFANILTSTILNDHLLPRISSSQIIANVSRTIHPGNIILLHDGGSHTQTVNAFPGIINTIHSQGYEIVRLEEVLATGTLQYQAAAYEITASEIAAAEATDGADGVIDVVVELRTYLELNTNLSAERRRMVEAMIAEARLAARG